MPPIQRSATLLVPLENPSASVNTLRQNSSPMNIDRERQQQLRPGGQSSQYYQQYVPRAGPFLHPSPTQLQSLAAVTPATTGSARKRPRAHNTAVPSLNRFSTPPSSVLTNTPPVSSISSFDHQRLIRYPTPSYYSHYSQISSYSTGSHFSTPASANIQSPDVPQSSGRRNEPWIADVHHQTNRRPSGVQSNAFDPYNDELLSDHSDHRDGSLSPVNYVFPKRDSM